MPYSYKIIGLIVFIGLMLLIDLKNPPRKRVRLKTYSFLLVSGLLGAAFGVGTDSITSRISADYFIYGKGLSAGTDFQSSVIALGAKAGFSAAVFAGCCLIVVNPVKNQIRYLYSYIAGIMFFSLLAAICFGLLQYASQVVQIKDVNYFFGDKRAWMFTTVWMTHIGVYTGAVMGIIWACINIRRKDHARERGLHDSQAN